MQLIIYGLILFVFFRMLIRMGWLYVDETNSWWHHAYTGIIFISLGKYQGGWIGLVLIILGLWMYGDDLYQHWRQRFDKSYHSFLHYAGKPLYQFRRWLVRKTGWQWLNWF